MMERKFLMPISISTTAPSSPGRNSCTNISEDYYFSEPTSPTHFLKADQLGISISSNDFTSKAVPFAWDDKANHAKNDDMSFEFGVSSRYSEADSDLVSAEELFVNGKIRPLNQQRSDGRNAWPPRPCRLTRVTPKDSDHSSSMNHKGRSSLRSFLREEEGTDKTMSPEDKFFRIHEGIKDSKSKGSKSSKRWSLKDFLYRSSSEGSKERMWGFSIIPPAKQAQKHSMSKKNNHGTTQSKINSSSMRYDEREIVAKSVQAVNGSAKNNNVNGSAKNSKRVGDIHYNKGHTSLEEESRRKSFLPYRRGLLGCLGFTTNSYTNVSGLSRTLHPFS